MKDEDEMYTIPAAAQAIGVSVETLYKAIQRGTLTSQTKYGRKVVTPQALNAWNRTRRMGRPPKK
jgi:hypothetical protein